MRIIETIKKTGHFWLPSKPDKKIVGILKIYDGGRIELETIGILESDLEEVSKLFSGKAENYRIVGIVEGGKYVTLERCFYKKHSAVLTGGVSSSLIHSNLYYEGVAFEESETGEFNTFEFSTEGMNEWVCKTGIELEYRRYPQLNNLWSAKVEYFPPSKIEIALNNGMKLIIDFRGGLPSSNSISEAKFTHRTVFRLTSDKARPIEEFASIASRIATLISFAIDEIVSINSVVVTSNDHLLTIGERTYPADIRVYFASLPYVEQPPKNIFRPFMLFSFIDIQQKAEVVINRWLDAYDTISPAFNLYFSTKSGAYEFIDGQFLALAQALETLHRGTADEHLMKDDDYAELVATITERCPEYMKWLAPKFKYGNEIPLRVRLSRMIDPFKTVFGSSSYRKRFVSKIVTARNYYTHYDESQTADCCEGNELINLCLKMEALLQLHFLTVVGFSVNEAIEISQKDNSIHKKLKAPRV